MHPPYSPKTVPRSDIPLPSAGSRSFRFPRFDGTIRMLRLPVSRPAALRFLRLAVPRSHPLFAPCDSRCQSHRPGPFLLPLGTPQFTLLPVEKTGPPKFLRDPNDLFAHALRLRRNRHATRHDRRGGLAPAKGTTRASARDFRSSITWLSGSLSTLRSAGLPDTTQDSLPAVG